MDQKSWHSLFKEEVANILKSDLKNGLTLEQIKKSRETARTKWNCFKRKKIRVQNDIRTI